MLPAVSSSPLQSLIHLYRFVPQVKNLPLNTIYIILHTISIPHRFSNHTSHSVPEVPRFLFLVNKPQTTSLTCASFLPLWHAKFQQNIILHTISIYASQIIKLRFRLHSKISEVSLSLWETLNKFNLSYTRILPRSLPLWHQRSIKHIIQLLPNIARKISAQIIPQAKFNPPLITISPSTYPTPSEVSLQWKTSKNLHISKSTLLR